MLRSTQNTPNTEILELVLGDGQSVTYRVPVLKVQQYNNAELFDKKLLLLLPFYILRYEKQLDQLEQNSEKMKEFLAEYEQILVRLEQATTTQNTGTFQDLVALIRKVMEYQLQNKEKLKERMDEMMGGRILPLPSDKLREERKIGEQIGKEIGEESGIELNRIALIQKKVKKKKTLAQIADDLEEQTSDISEIYEVVKVHVNKTPKEILLLWKGEN